MSSGPYKPDGFLLHDLILDSSFRHSPAEAVEYDGQSLSYSQLSEKIEAFSLGLAGLGVTRMDRVGILLEKCNEYVISAFAISKSGGVFVPINHILKLEQIKHIINDCQIKVLISSEERRPIVEELLECCPSLEKIVLKPTNGSSAPSRDKILNWLEVKPGPSKPALVKVIDSDVVAIFYTSGSTGKAKGVVLTHRNMVVGAKSVATYLENKKEDRILAALPLSFDAGFSQLTTAFAVGAKVFLINYFSPIDLLESLEKHKITGMTAVPPLWIQLVNSSKKDFATKSLRYFATTGGKMPFEILQKLRVLFPGSKPFLMYGLTEAFRATYLDPNEVDQRPNSIGKSIPNSEVLVLNEFGNLCADDEVGELVQRGALVSLGYWNDKQKTAERFKYLPKGIPSQNNALPLSEWAVFSGDYVKRDKDGFLYFIGRKDEMIKTSGYRISPNEVEEIVYSIPTVNECSVFGTEDLNLGQAVCLVVHITDENTENDKLEFIRSFCRKKMPLYMIPAVIILKDLPLPRNSNGKIDRRFLKDEYESSKK